MNTNSLKIYLESLPDPFLTKKQEIELIKKAQEGCEISKNKVIESNLRFVVTTAKHFDKGTLPIEDLISEGNYGLCKAIERYNTDSGYKFITYAVWWIRESIIQSIRTNSRNVRMPSGNNQYISKVIKFQESYYNQFGSIPTPQQIAKALNIKEASVQYVLDSMQFSVGIDDKETEDEISILDKLAQYDEPYEIKENVQSEIKELLFEYLPDIHAYIIYYIYILGLHIDDVSDRLCLCNSTIRKYKKVALNELKKHPSFAGLLYD